MAIFQRKFSLEQTSCNVEEKIYFWQNFIWQTWHERVNQNLNGYLLLEYQGYYYLSRRSLQAKPEVFKIEVDREFDYQERKFVLSKKKLSYPMVGDFWMQKTPIFLFLNDKPLSRIFEV